MSEVRCYLCHGEGDSCPRCGGKGTIELAGIVGVMTEEGIEMGEEPKCRLCSICFFRPETCGEKPIRGKGPRESDHCPGFKEEVN